MEELVLLTIKNQSVVLTEEHQSVCEINLLEFFIFGS